MEKLQPISLSQEFRDILNEIEGNNHSFFITGRAGTGKSTLLNLFKRTSKKNVVTLAPTGIAALNVGGQTIHSFFGLPPKMIQPSEIYKRKNHRLYKKIDILIIDEISMVRADLLDTIDIFLQKNREVAQPFGGVQVIFFGDLFQLPPVIASPYERKVLTDMYESPYFFSSRAYKSCKSLQMIELHTVYRQSEKRFIQLLDNIRRNTFDEDDLRDLNERAIAPTEPGHSYITLCSTNAIANTLNASALNALNKPDRFFNGTVTGKFSERIYPTDINLRLKDDAQVMFVKNDPQKRFVNGSLGTILSMDAQSVTVRMHGKYYGGKTIEVSKMDWEITKYVVDPANPAKFKTEVVGVYSQIPLKLAWAMTIHKSQGKTFEHVIVDLGRGAFDYGQTYVALSRCKTFDGLILKNPLRPRDIIIDRRIQEFYETQRLYL